MVSKFEVLARSVLRELDTRAWASFVSEMKTKQLVYRPPGRWTSKYRIDKELLAWVLEEESLRVGISTMLIWSGGNHAICFNTRSRVFFRLHREFDYSLPVIGEDLGWDHTTVYWGTRHAEKKIAGGKGEVEGMEY